MSARKKYPDVVAYDTGQSLVIVCPHGCRRGRRPRLHYHGRGEDGRAYGPRVAHCGGDAPGYVLVPETPGHPSPARQWLPREKLSARTSMSTEEREKKNAPSHPHRESGASAPR